MATAVEMTDSISATTPPLLLYALAVVVITLIVSLSLVRKATDAGHRLPPGPPALLFLARFLVLRRSIYELAPLLRELHARYGPVISLRLPRTLVLVADRRLAHKLLVQGGATFSDRPPLVDPSGLFTAGDVSSSPYSAYWRLVRRNLAAEALQPARVALFAPARRRAGDSLIDKLLRPQSAGDAVVTLRPFLRRAMFELLVYMCFGRWLGQDALDEIEGLQLQAILSLTTFPVFAFFPALTKRLFRRRWEAFVAMRRRQDEVFVPLIHATPTRPGGDSPPCYADSLRALRVPEEEGDRPLTDAEMVSLCSEFLNASTDIAVMLEWIMAELVNHQDVQAMVHEEAVRSSSSKSNGGGDDDVQVQAMPYLKAVVMEGLRLHPPTHFLIPRSVRIDDAVDVGGYTVPRGAEVNFLVAEIGRDETVWTAAQEFRPDRFLDGGEGCGVDITGSREIKMMPFGAGRRMCPGYSLGIHCAEYFVARLVRDLEWRPPVEGVAVDMAEELGFTVVMKQPLRARIVARH